MPMGTSPADVEALMDRHRVVADEAIVRLHGLRQDGARQDDEWRRKCQAVERASAEKLRRLAVPLRDTLCRAIERVDRLLEGSG